MYRTFHRVIAFFVVAAFVALSFPTQISAQKAGDFGANCENNPSSCSCSIAFRDNDSGTITVLRGGTSSDNLGNNWVLSAGNLDYSYSFFVTRPSSDATDNCQVKQELSTPLFDWGGAKEKAVENCPKDYFNFNPAGCVGAAAGGAVNGYIVQNILHGNWSGMSDDSFECGWHDDYDGGNGDRNHKKGGGNPGWRISPWQKLNSKFNDEKASRITFQGKRGFIDPLAKDEFYCGMMVFRRPDDEVIEDVAFELCKQAPEGDQRDKCEACIGNNDDKGIWTALGCIKALPEDILSAAVRIMLSIAGGAAMLRVLIAGFIFSTSRGNPERTGKAKEMITQAVVGLIFLIFSVSILEFIGFTILRIPGFGG